MMISYGIQDHTCIITLRQIPTFLLTRLGKQLIIQSTPPITLHTHTKARKEKYIDKYYLISILQWNPDEWLHHMRPQRASWTLGRKTYKQTNQKKNCTHVIPKPGKYSFYNVEHARHRELPGRQPPFPSWNLTHAYMLIYDDANHTFLLENEKSMLFHSMCG